MPIVQAIIFIIILIVWAEDFNLYNNKLIYFQPFVAASILSGMWGVMMTVKTIITLGHNPRPRLLIIQLALIIVKVQVGITKSLAEGIHMGCLMKLHPIVFAFMVQYSVMMVEMLLLSIVAWRLYRTPPGKDSIGLPKDKSISTIDDNIRSIEVKAIKEGIDNKTFNNNENYNE